MLQNHFFCKFSKTSEKIAYLQKKVCRNPQRSSRCRYERRKKSQIDTSEFFLLPQKSRQTVVSPLSLLRVSENLVLMPATFQDTTEKDPGEVTPKAGAHHPEMSGHQSQIRH